MIDVIRAGANGPSTAARDSCSVATVAGPTTQPNPPKEIARALGRSHAAIRVAQLRAYARLRSLLRPSQDDPNPPASDPLHHEHPERPERPTVSRREPTR